MPTLIGPLRAAARSLKGQLQNQSGLIVYLRTIINLFVTSKNETTNSPSQEFKVLQNVVKMKKQGLECFVKVINIK